MELPVSVHITMENHKSLMENTILTRPCPTTTRTTADRRPWSFRAFKVLFDDFECVITMVLTVNVFSGLFMALCHAEMAKLMVLPQRGVNFGGFGKRRNYFHRAFIFSSSPGHSNASNICNISGKRKEIVK